MKQEYDAECNKKIIEYCEKKYFDIIPIVERGIISQASSGMSNGEFCCIYDHSYHPIDFRNLSKKDWINLREYFRALGYRCGISYDTFTFFYMWRKIRGLIISWSDEPDEWVLRHTDR